MAAANNTTSRKLRAQGPFPGSGTQNGTRHACRLLRCLSLSQAVTPSRAYLFQEARSRKHGVSSPRQPTAADELIPFSLKRQNAVSSCPGAGSRSLASQCAAQKGIYPASRYRSVELRLVARQQPFHKLRK